MPKTKRWIKAWVSRHRDSLIAWSFPALAFAIAGSYYPIRQMMIEQESQVTVIASTLTVVLIVSLYIIGWGIGFLIEKYLVNRPRVIRWGAFICALLIVFGYLELMGYEVIFL